MIVDKENALLTPVKPALGSTSVSLSVGESSIGSIAGDVGHSARKKSSKAKRRRSSLSFVEESLDSEQHLLSVKPPQISYTPIRKSVLSVLPPQQEERPEVRQQARNLFFKRRRRLAVSSPQAAKRKKQIVCSVDATLAGDSTGKAGTARESKEGNDEVEVDSMGRAMEQSDLAAPKSVLEETFDYYDTHCADLIKSVDVSSIGAGSSPSRPGDKISLRKEEQAQELELEGESFIDPEYNI